MEGDGVQKMIVCFPLKELGLIATVGDLPGHRCWLKESSLEHWKFIADGYSPSSGSRRSCSISVLL